MLANAGRVGLVRHETEGRLPVSLAVAAACSSFRSRCAGSLVLRRRGAPCGPLLLRGVVPRRRMPSDRRLRSPRSLSLPRRPRRLPSGRGFARPASGRGPAPPVGRAPRAGAHTYVSRETRPCSPAGRQPPRSELFRSAAPRPACGPPACSHPPHSSRLAGPRPRIHCRLPQKWPKTLRFTPLGGRIAASRQSRPGETRSSPR